MHHETMNAMLTGVDYFQYTRFPIAFDSADETYNRIRKSEHN